MDERLTYSDCELRYIDQGYDPARAAEVCANAEGGSSDEEKGKTSQDENWDEYWGET